MANGRTLSKQRLWGMLGRFAHIRPRRADAGSAISSALIAISITGVVATTAWVARPAYLHAQSPTHESVAARSERNQEIVDLLANLIGSSAEVVAVYPRGATPYAEVVLRIAGEGDAVQSDEVAVLSHSRVLQSLMLYTHGDVQDDLHRAELFASGFPDRWRGDPNVKPILLASGLSDMDVQVVEPGLLRIALTWAADSADGEDESMVYVQAMARSG